MDPIQAINNLKKVQELLHLVIRAYYTGTEVIIMDVLLNNDHMRDDQLASGIGINIKELQRVCARLKGQGLLSTIARPEEIPLGKKEIEAYRIQGEEYNSAVLKAMKDGLQPPAPPLPRKERRKINRSYYYLDYGLAVNVIKWKLYKIQKNIDSQVVQAKVMVPYACSLCGHVYPALEMLSLESTPEGVFLCEIDRGELVEDDSVDTHAGNAQFQKFMRESKPILDILKTIDDLYIPESKPHLPVLVREGIIGPYGSSSGEVKNIDSSKDGGILNGNNLHNQIIVEFADGEGETAPVKGEGDEEDELRAYYASLAAVKQEGDSAVNTPASTSAGGDSAFGGSSVPVKREHPSSSDEDDDEEFEEIE